MSGYLLDTDTASHAIRDPRGVVAARVAERRNFGLAISLITAAELRFGAARRPGTHWHRDVLGFLTRIEILPVQPPADVLYAGIRAALARQGRLIGANDLWLAAHALALDRTLVTGNDREFSRVPGLRVENWLA